MSLIRTTDIVLIGAMLAAAAFTYKTKHEAENRLAEVRRLEQQIRFEQDTISVLNADWSLLTQPSRLQTLAEVYADQLQLQIVEPTQITDIDRLPERPLRIDDILRDEMAGAAQDPVTTSGVMP